MEIKNQILRTTGDYNPIKEICLEYLDTSYKIESEFILLNHQPVIAPQFYAIVLYFGLKKVLIDDYQTQHSIKIPVFYQNFLSKINGLSIFSFVLFGIAKSMLNKPPLIDREKRQSMDISINSEFYEESFLFGFRHYSYDKNIDYYLTKKDSVLGIVDKQIIFEWNDFNMFLSDEIEAAKNFTFLHQN